MDKRVSSIIFVCLGNICRSPIAEGIARDIIRKRGLEVEVDSAGTGDWHVGENPCPDSIKIAKMNNIDISYMISRQVTRDDFKKFDLIVGLDDSNIENLKKMGAKDVVKLGEFGFEGEDVADPYFFNGFEGFDKVYNMIDICVNNLLDKITSTR